MRFSYLFPDETPTKTGVDCQILQHTPQSHSSGPHGQGKHRIHLQNSPSSGPQRRRTTRSTCATFTQSTSVHARRRTGCKVQRRERENERDIHADATANNVLQDQPGRLFVRPVHCLPTLALGNANRLASPLFIPLASQWPFSKRSSNTKPRDQQRVQTPSFTLVPPKLYCVRSKVVSKILRTQYITLTFSNCI